MALLLCETHKWHIHNDHNSILAPVRVYLLTGHILHSEYFPHPNAGFDFFQQFVVSSNLSVYFSLVGADTALFHLAGGWPQMDRGDFINALPLVAAVVNTCLLYTSCPQRTSLSGGSEWWGSSSSAPAHPGQVERWQYIRQKRLAGSHISKQ